MTKEEAIKILKDFHDKSALFSVRTALETLYPELKESEDEKVRKELLAWLKNTEGQVLPMDRYNAALAWLEKQGEQKPTDEPKFNTNDWIVRELDNTCYQIKNCILNVTNNKYGYDLTSGGHISSQDANFYHLWTIQDAKDGDMIYVSTEKEGIQAIFHKYEGGIIYFHCRLCRDFMADGYMPIGTIEFLSPLQKKQYQRFFAKMHEAGYEWDAEKKELKKIVAPKFEVGDWIVFNGLTLYIKEVVKGFYRTISKGGIPNSYDWDIDNVARLWTIQDTKDGDVLNSPSHRLIWIYKDKEHYHACVNMNYVTDIVSTNGLISIPNNVCPTTKDEQTVLLAGMKEASYEWDVEKKELKKIEQKSDSYCREHCKGFQETGKCFADGACSAKIEAEQKSAWGEEDEKFFKTALWHISYSISNGKSTDIRCDTTEWLKSLKDRYTWKPSDEQIEILDMVLTNESLDDNIARILRELKEQLKKLREE